MVQESALFADEIKLGKKGQITIPKKIREKDSMKEGDRFILVQMPGGGIVLRKKIERVPEDLILEAVRKAPKINWMTVWTEVEKERSQER